METAASADLFHGPHLGTIRGARELGWGVGVFIVTIGVSIVGDIALWRAAPQHPMPPTLNLVDG